MRCYFHKINRLLASLSLFFPLISSANNACLRLDNDIKIASWTYEVMLQTYNFNFVNPDTEKAQTYFTKPAWLNYKKEFNIDENIKEVVNKKLVSSVGLGNSPLFLKKSPNSWTLRLPLILNYQSATELKTKKINVAMTIIKDIKEHDCLKVAAIHKIPIAKQ